MKKKSFISLVLVVAMALATFPSDLASAKVKLNATSKKITVGKTATIKISGAKSVKWSVSNKKIKIIKKTNSYAKVKAINEGISFLNAKVGRKTYKCTVLVKKKVSNPVPTTKPTEKESYISDFSISNQSIYNKNGISININSIEEDNAYVSIEFLVENKTEIDYSVYPRQYAINDLMAGGNNYAPYDVTIGKKIKFSISIKKDWLKENNIEKIKKIDIYFTFKHDYKNIWDTETITIKSDLDDGIYYEPKGTEVFSDKDIVIYLLSSNKESYKFCLKSSLIKNDYWSVENCSINDWMYDLGSCKYDLFGKPILSNTFSVFELVVDKDFMEKNDIKCIKDIEFEIDFGKDITTKKVQLEL